eukprot:5084963-Lingulodinium_polyedra.AAC.1
MGRLLSNSNRSRVWRAPTGGCCSPVGVCFWPVRTPAGWRAGLRAPALACVALSSGLGGPG